jgi:hypothetical protein
MLFTKLFVNKNKEKFIGTMIKLLIFLEMEKIIKSKYIPYKIKEYMYKDVHILNMNISNVSINEPLYN